MLKELSLAGLIPVIQIGDANDAVELCRALEKGGLPVAEITFRTGAAEESIRRVAGELPEVLLGAGTVLTVEQARRAVSAGAKYIVSPGLNPRVVEWCVENGIPVLPGCANPTDVEKALEYGLSMVKFFPAEALGGVKLIRAMSAPFGGVKFVPTGGIHAGNALEYLNCPFVAAVGGSWMAPQDAIRGRDWRRITELARESVNLMLGLSVCRVGISENCEGDARRDALALSTLLGWEAFDRGGAWFAGEGFEVMKKPGRGEKGHIVIAANSVERAMAQWKRRGFAFEDEPVTDARGEIRSIYLKQPIGGFAICLTAK